MHAQRWLPFHARKASAAQLRLISRFGTEGAWLSEASKTEHAARLIPILMELKPWQRKPGNLCLATKDRQLVLIEKVFIRLPDQTNNLNEPMLERCIIDHLGSKNVLSDQTQWIYLRGNESSQEPDVTYARQRKRGVPRNKALRF
jgi:hypothetical protein